MARLFTGRCTACDSLDSHTKGAFYEAFAPARAPSLVRRIEFSYAERHGSWLHVRENELSSLTRQCVSGRCLADLMTLSEETDAWSTDVNATLRGVDWQMKISDARTEVIGLGHRMAPPRGPFTAGSPRWGRVRQEGPAGAVRVTRRSTHPVYGPTLLARGCTAAIGPHRGPPCLHGIPLTRSASPSSDALGLTLDGCEPHSFPSKTRSRAPRCTLAGCSSTGGRGQASHDIPLARFPADDADRAGSARSPAEAFDRRLSDGTSV